MTRVLDLGVISLTYVSPGTAITISGADPSSFADGSPGFQTCTGELLPFAVGSTLFTDWGGGLPVLTVDATATSSPRGVRVDWSAPEGFEPARVQILRRSSNRDFVVAATLAGQRQGSWLDEDFLPGSSEGVIYRITMEEGERSAVSAEIAVQQGDTPGLVVSRDRLLPNVPNPFNPSTDLRFALAEHGRARLEIYDTAGRRVWTWSREGLSAGEHTTTWTGLDDHGRRVSSGVYIVRLRTAQAVDHQRIVMLK
jgi:hypothetical protein